MALVLSVVVIVVPPCLLVHLAFRDLTFPGWSHLSRRGWVSLYPGQATPDAMQCLHAGRVKSQTKLRRRHS